MECCFTNTVERLISAVMAEKAARQMGFLKRRLFHAAKDTATAPSTWIEGQTFVSVSKA